MKKIFIPIVLLAMACNNSTEKAETPKVEAPPQSTQQQVDNSPQKFFSGGNTSDNWSIEIDAAPDGSFPVVIKDAAANSQFSGKLMKMELMVGGKPAVSSGEIKLTGNLEHQGTNQEITISLLASECKDASGTHTHAVSFELDGKKRQGCGDYAE